MRTTSSVQLQEYHHNTVSIIEEDLKEAKKLEEDAIQVHYPYFTLPSASNICKFTPTYPSSQEITHIVPLNSPRTIDKCIW